MVVTDWDKFQGIPGEGVCKSTSWGESSKRGEGGPRLSGATVGKLKSAIADGVHQRCDTARRREKTANDRSQQADQERWLRLLEGMYM